MPLNKDQKFTVGTGIAVVLAVFVIVLVLRPHEPASPNPSAAGAGVTDATPAVTPTEEASPVAAEPTMSLTPVIISTDVPLGK
jgi:hypothetical protein